MQQGNKKKKQREARRKAHMLGRSPQPGTNGQQQRRPPQGGVPSQPFGVQPAAPTQAHPSLHNETRPGAHRAIPQAQIQPHQAVRRTGDVGPAVGQPGTAPQAGVSVPVPFTQPTQSGQPVQARETPRETQVVDVTVVLYSSGQAPQFLAAQVEALRRQTVHARDVWVHVDGPQGHDERTLTRLRATRTPVTLGSYFRLALARNVPSQYVALLDEDTIPGPTWLERSLAALEENDDPENPSPFGAAVIACAGSQLVNDDPAQARIVGPEYPHGDDVAVDYGRQGWVFRTDFARVADSIPPAGWGSLSFSFAVGMAASSAEVPTVVLGYGRTRQTWLAEAPTQLVDDSDDVYEAYARYRQHGWDPAFIGSPEGAPAPQPIESGGALGGPEWAQPPEEEEVGNARAGIPPAVDSEGNYPPGARVTHQGQGDSAVTTVETVIPKEHSTQRTGTVERVLGPHEHAPPPVHAQTERILAQPTPPPKNQATEQVVGSSTPPPYQATERVLGAPQSAAPTTPKR